MHSFNLNQSTANQLGQRGGQTIDMRTGAGVQQSHTRTGLQDNSSPYGVRGTYDGNNGTTQGVFRNQHRSVAQNEPNSLYQQNRDFTSGNISKGLYRVNRFETGSKFRTPVETQSRLDNLTRRGEQTPPLYSQMAPKNKTRGLYDMTPNQPSRVRPGTMIADLQSSTSGLRGGLQFGQTHREPDNLNVIDTLAEEQSTSKPSFQPHLMRNPTLQASLIEKQNRRNLDAQHQDLSYVRPTQQPKASNMSFGVSAINKPSQGLLGKSSHQDQEERLEKLDRVQLAGQINFSQADLKDANKAVSEKIETQMMLTQNTQQSDFLNTVRVNQATYEPLTFLPKSQFEIPTEILQAIQSREPEETFVTEMSKRHPVIYFGIGRRLFVWDYKNAQQKGQRLVGPQNPYNRQQRDNQRIADMIETYSFKDQIKSILELNSVNRHAVWQQASQAIPDCRYVIVSTQSEIKLLTVKRLTSGDQLSVQEQGLDALQHGATSNIVEFEKLGRVFYAREEGRVSELLFENTTVNAHKSMLMTIKAFTTGTQKRLKKVEHQKESLILRAIPSFLKFTHQNKEIVQLRVDEQRNLLFALSQTDRDMSVIEVHDLGMLGNEFKHQTTIQMHEIHDEMQDKGWLKRGKNDSRDAWAQDHRIVDIQPVQYSESQVCNIILTTCQSERIFIELGTEPKDIDNSVLVETQLEELGIQSDYLIQEKIVAGQWQIKSVLTEFPEEEDVLQSEKFGVKVMHSLFGEHQMRDRTKMKMMNKQEPLICHFDSEQSLYIYQVTDGMTSSQDERSGPDFKLRFLSKSEAQNAQQRQQCAQGSNQLDSLQESFALIKISSIEVESFRKYLNLLREEQHKQEYNERLIKLSGFKREGQSMQALITLGGFKPQEDKPQWNDMGYVLPYLPSCELDRQVFLQSGNLGVLTNRRLILISQMRPVDKLYGILSSIIDSNKDQQMIYDDFLDFANSFTFEETSAMLVQILSDPKAQYQVSHRMDQLLRHKRAVINREARNQRDRFAHSGTPNLRSAGTSSINRNRGGTFQANQLSKTKTFYGRNDTSIRQFGGDASSKPSHSLPRGDNFQAQNALQPHSEEHNILDQLSSFDPSQGSFVHLRQSHKSIQKVALDLLIKFGDSVSVLQEQNLSSCLEQGMDLSNMNAEASRLSLYSNKHKGLYLFAHRVLRPIWNMKISTFATARSLDMQVFNIKAMLPVQERLFNLRELIMKNERAFVGQTCQNRSLLSEDSPCVLLNQMNPQVAERIEVAERKSLTQLKAFVQRCLDVIEFLIHIEDEVESQNRKFSELMKQMGSDDQILLSRTQYRDFVMSKTNDLASKLLEKTIFMHGTEDAKLSEQMLRQKQQRVSQLCPTIFSPLESRFFFGMTLIENAGREKDPERQTEMVIKALDILMDDPNRIEMQRIIPMLTKIRKFEEIVIICMRKVQEAMRFPDRAEDIQELLDIVVQVVDALSRGIEDDRQDSIYGQDYNASFLREIMKMKLDHKTHVRTNIVAYLSNCEVKEGIKNLLRAFLIKNRNVDFIYERLSDEIVESQSLHFVTEQSNHQLLTKQQFFSIVRLLKKSKKAHMLAQIVQSLLLEQIMLFEEPVDSQSVDVEPIRCQLDCESRQQLVKESILLMEFCMKSGQTNMRSDAIAPSQITGMEGSRNEMRQQLYNQLQEFLKGLDAQADTLKSVEAKIELIELFLRQRRNQQEQEKEKSLIEKSERKLASLKPVKDDLQFSLLSKDDMKALYSQNQLYDRSIIQLFQIKVGTQADIARLRDLQQSKLRSLVNEINTYSEYDDDKYRQEFKRQISSIFTSDVIEQSRQQLFYAADMAIDRVPCTIQNLLKGDSLWIQDFLVKELRVAPSQLLRHYLQMKDKIGVNDKLNDQEKRGVLSLSLRICFERCLTLMSSWAKLVQDCPKVDLKEALFKDLMVHGITLYQEVFNNFCYDHLLSDEMLQMSKFDAQASRDFYTKVSDQMAHVLERCVKTFNRPIAQHRLPPVQKLPSYDDARPQIVDKQDSQKASGPTFISLSFQQPEVQKSQAIEPAAIVSSARHTQEDQHRRSMMESEHRQRKSFNCSGSITRTAQPSQQQKQLSQSQTMQMIDTSQRSQPVAKKLFDDHDDRDAREDSVGSQLIVDQEAKPTSLRQMRERSRGNRQ